MKWMAVLLGIGSIFLPNGWQIMTVAMLMLIYSLLDERL